MPKEFRGLLSGEISRIDSKTEFNGKSISNAARKAIVVSPHDDMQPEPEIVQINGNPVRVYAYRIYIEESIGNSELGTLIYPMPGTSAEAEYLKSFPESEQEYQRKQLLMSSTKIGYFKRDETIGESLGYGSEVLATPIQEGLLSDRFTIVPTGNKQKLNASRGLAPSKTILISDFSGLSGQSSFSTENGQPITSAGGSVSVASNAVNYDGLAPEAKTALNDLASQGYDLIITSAFRSAGENQSIAGSSPNSAHKSGLAVDIRVRDTDFATNTSSNWELTPKGRSLVNAAQQLGFSFVEKLNHGSGPHIHLELSEGTSVAQNTTGFPTSEETGQ